MRPVLLLKTVNADMTSYNGFVWPEKGIVECPDWNPKPVCGGGLHGLLWGCGDGSLLNWSKDAKWIVFEAEESFVVDIKGKVKVPAGEVIYCGNQEGALEILQKARPDLVSMMVGGKATASGYNGKATASGYNGTATASGNYGTATASGYNGTATASGNYGKATASGDNGKATASGDNGTATASGDNGKATASGDNGTATASGNYGKATASGDNGKATAGYLGTVEAGMDGCMCLTYRASVLNRYMMAVANVGLDGIKAATPYQVNDKGEFMEVKK